MLGRLHDDELDVSVELVTRLIESQFPDYAGLPLSELSASGSSNRLFRLGDALLARLPRQPGGGESVDKERRWNTLMARHLPVAVPEIIGVGRPAHGFPEQWSIVRWIDGDLPWVCVPDLAAELAEVILALRAIPVPAEAINDPTLRSYRGRPLAEFDRTFRRNLESCRTLNGFDLDLEAALRLWDKALELPGAAMTDERTWFHGDLVAENLLMTDGRLTAVLDFGGLSIGDPSIDLHGAWELFDPPARDLFRRRLEVDEAEWLRGRAWALAIALGCFSYYWESMPDRCHHRLAMARAALADFG